MKLFSIEDRVLQPEKPWIWLSCKLKDIGLHTMVVHVQNRGKYNQVVVHAKDEVSMCFLAFVALEFACFTEQQTVVTKSTIKAEFFTLDKVWEQAKWLCQFPEDILRWEMPGPSFCIFCVSTTTIGTMERVLYNKMSRHIRCRHNSFRQLLSNRSEVITVNFLVQRITLLTL